MNYSFSHPEVYWIYINSIAYACHSYKYVFIQDLTNESLSRYLSCVRLLSAEISAYKNLCNKLKYPINIQAQKWLIDSKHIEKSLGSREPILQTY